MVSFYADAEISALYDGTVWDGSIQFGAVDPGISIVPLRHVILPPPLFSGGRAVRLYPVPVLFPEHRRAAA